LQTAVENIRKPKEFDRQIAREKIWDAFEPSNKRDSAITLTKNIAAGTA
jgi:hypothetical protein